MPELTFPTPPLADGLVLMRPWREADVTRGLLGFRDPVVQRFSWPLTTPYTEDDAHRFFVSQQRSRLRGDSVAFAFVDPTDDGDVLGGGSLYDMERQDGRAAVGYWVAAEARGRGVATHAVRLMSRWAFATLGLSRLQLTCGPDNLASQRVAQRCGFVREGLLRSHIAFKGGRRDTVVYGLLPGELV